MRINNKKMETKIKNEFKRIINSLGYVLKNNPRQQHQKLVSLI